MSLRLLALFAVLLAAFVAADALTQPPAPPLAEYDVQIRYDIDAFRNERVAQYRQLLKALQQIGFVLDTSKVEDSDPEDVRATRLYGTIAAGKARELLLVRNIRTVLLASKGVKSDDKAPVRVQLELAQLSSLERQRQLAEQMRLALLSLNFKEAVAYDHRGYTRMIGSMPAGQIETLLNDVRLVPTGWSLLRATLLADLRKHQGGGNLLESILYDWTKTDEGKRAVAAGVEDWRLEPAAKKFAATLPLDPTDKIEASVLQEQLMVQMAHHADARDTLQTLLARVMRDEKAPELMAMLLRRVNAHPANVELPLLYRSTAPLRLIEEQNQPGSVLPAGRLPAPAVPAGQERIDPELRELLKDATKSAQPLRFEVLLAQAPQPDEYGWRAMFKSVSDVAIEGRLGPLVTVYGSLADVLKLAAIPEVVGVRLPRVGRANNLKQTLPSASEMAGLMQSHETDHRGQKPLIAVIHTDFQGWDKAIADGKLPATTRLLDLTRERNRNLEADPYPGAAVEMGGGLRHVIDTAKVAREAELILVRVDAAAPYMLQNAASAINGDAYRSVALDQRQRDIEVDGQLLKNRADDLLRERREAINNLSEDYLDQAKTKKAFDVYQTRQKQYDADEKVYNQRVRQMVQHRKDLDALKTVRIVTSTLTWNDGYPIDGGSTLSRWFDDRPFKAATWFQAASDTHGQAWTDLFRDEDGNGVMEFAPANQPLPKGGWTNELNFLAWQSAKEAESLDLPANAKIRLSVQWREAHDPAFAEAREDVYREPLANLKLVLLYQPDPEGKKEPADDMVEQLESSGIPQRLEATATGATYEQTLTFTTTKAGRYAVRIEGRAPDGTRPERYPTVPIAKKSFELRPRLFVETLDGPGRALLHSYSTEAGEIGMPADAHNVIPIGTAGAK